MNVKKNKSLYLLSRLYRVTLLRFYRTQKQRYEEWYYSERRNRFGWRHKNETYYIVRRKASESGLMSLLLTNLMRIEYALKKGYVPIIDMQNIYNVYLTDRQIGKVNAWEFYFEQPSGYDLENVKLCKNVVWGDCDVLTSFPYNKVSFWSDYNESYLYWKGIAQEYIRLNETTSRYIKNLKEELFGGHKVVGVKCRGTDYMLVRPSGHPVQPDVDDVIDKTKEIIERYNCDTVFLSTEDKEIYEKFRRSFGEILVTNKTHYISYNTGSIGQGTHTENEDKNYMEGLEYVSQIMLLSSCDCLVAGLTSGTIGALLFTSGYEYKYIFDLGVYP